MKNLTISQAMVKRSELEKLYCETVNNVESIFYNSIIKNKELDGKEFLKHEIKDFEKEFNKMIMLSDEMDSLKSLISQANNTCKINIDGKDITIQECLNRLATYRKRVDIISRILKKSKDSEERRVDASGTAPYYIITKPNFDKSEMEETLDLLNKKIIKMELALNEANNQVISSLI